MERKVAWNGGAEVDELDLHFQIVLSDFEFRRNIDILAYDVCFSQAFGEEELRRCIRKVGDESLKSFLKKNN